MMTHIVFYFGDETTPPAFYGATGRKEAEQIKEYIIDDTNLDENDINITELTNWREKILPYFLMECRNCGWIGSSEHVSTIGADAYCPKCSTHMAWEKASIHHE